MLTVNFFVEIYLFMPDFFENIENINFNLHKTYLAFTRCCHIIC